MFGPPTHYIVWVGELDYIQSYFIEATHLAKFSFKPTKIDRKKVKIATTIFFLQMGVNHENMMKFAVK